MEFKPGLPEHNDNVTDEHPLKDFTILLIGLFALFVAAYFVVGLLVDFSVSKISPERESKWFFESKFSQQIIRSLADDKIPDAFEFETFGQLKKCAGITVPINLTLHKSEVINAVAIPGGTIIVFSGLIDQIESENGLAFVLAHELAHFKNRDHLRGMGRGLVLVGLTALVTGGNSSLTNVVGSFAGFEQSRYSKSREADADITALSILNCAYGHVGGATEFFTSMANDDAGVFEKFSHYFSSHPEALVRVRIIEQLAKSKAFETLEVKPLSIDSVESESGADTSANESDG